MNHIPHIPLPDFPPNPVYANPPSVNRPNQVSAVDAEGNDVRWASLLPHIEEVFEIACSRCATTSGYGDGRSGMDAAEFFDGEGWVQERGRAYCPQCSPKPVDWAAMLQAKTREVMDDLSKRAEEAGRRPLWDTFEWIGDINRPNTLRGTVKTVLKEVD